MAKVTLYLDEDTQALIERGALASGQSKSRWVAEAIRQHAPEAWPDECLQLAGRFADFPMREDAPAAPGMDVLRVEF